MTICFTKIMLPLTLVLILASCQLAHSDTTFNVKDYGAVGDGVTDDSPAIQKAISAAETYGDANNHAPVTVLVPAGTYLISSAAIDIEKSYNLTFTGAGIDKTMLWYTIKKPRCFQVWYNTNLTVENFSADTAKDPITGQYELGETQGTITSIDRAAKQVDVTVENGYPLLNRPDIQNAPTDNGWSKPFYLHPDPTRLDLFANATILNVAPSVDGRTGVITLDQISSNMYIGETWMIWHGPDNIFMDAGYGDYGNTVLQNFNFYGGGLHGAMGDAGGTGSFTLNHVYGGPPPYQPDRLLTCDEGWGAVSGRAQFNYLDSKFLRTWDDTFDCHDGDTEALSQPAPNEVIGQGGGDYQVNDTVELIDNTTQPTGAYARMAVTAVHKQNNNTYFTFNQNFALHNPGKDRLNDVSQAGPIVANNCVFNSCNGRHVYFFSGTSVTVTGCTFLDDTPLECAGWDDSESPSSAHNDTIAGNTFIGAAGIYIAGNGGNDTAPCGSNVKIIDNRFLSCGRTGSDPIDSQPINVSNVTGVTVSGNYFDQNWGVNAQFHHDADLTVSNNTFCSPNQIKGWDRLDTSVIAMSDVQRGIFSGNVVYNAGLYTNALITTDHVNVDGLQTGLTEIDGPLSLFLNYDQLVVGGVAAAHQAAWTGAQSQNWIAQIVPNEPGCFTLTNNATGQALDNGGSPAPRSPVVVQGSAVSTTAPTPSQTWSLLAQSPTDSNIVNKGSGLALHVKGDSPVPGAPLIQWKPSASECQQIQVVTEPKVHVIEERGTVAVSWPVTLGVESYAVGRSSTPNGHYSVIADNLTTSPYVDKTAPVAVPSFYVVKANGLPVANDHSATVWTVPNGDYLPLDLSADFDTTGIVNNGWQFSGDGFVNGSALPAAAIGSRITSNGRIFQLGASNVPDAVADNGQRILLPHGAFSHLSILADYVGGAPGSTGTFPLTITYADFSNRTIVVPMTNWHSSASQSGESDALMIPKLTGSDGEPIAAAAYIHTYDVSLDTSKGLFWLTLPQTETFRILAIDVSGADHSIIEAEETLMPGEFLISPDRQSILTQEDNGSLTIYSGSSPANRGAMLWSSGYSGAAGPSFTVLQPDGNLVTYLGTPSKKGTAVWATDTNPLQPNTIRILDGGKLQLLHGDNVVWQRP